VPVCPACGFASTDDGAACARCGLSVELFVPVREAAGLPESDPEFGRAVQEILDAVGGGGSPPPDSPTSPRLAQAFRFPTLGPPRPESPPAEDDALPPIRGLPELPPAKELAVVRRQVEEYLQIARRQGLDTTDFVERARSATAAGDAGSFEALSRELFIHIAGSITEEFESLAARRNELARIAPTSGPDVEFESCRTSLALGDVGGAQRRLRHLDDTLGRLEEEWTPTLILIGQAEALAETTRELGGDPSPALGPLREGRRLAKSGDRAAAEPVLARAGLALWSVLEPTFLSELARLKDRLLAEREAGHDVGPALVELRSIAPDLRRRSFLAMIDSYRRLRDLTGAPGTPPPAASPAS
jgi:hypothetical protein